MDNDFKALITFISIVVGSFVTAVLVNGALDNYAIMSLVSKGADPIAAMCAVQRDSRSQICMTLVVKK